jgi:hypothetical protein
MPEALGDRERGCWGRMAPLPGLMVVSCLDVGLLGTNMIVFGDHWNAVVHR